MSKLHSSKNIGHHRIFFLRHFNFWDVPPTTEDVHVLQVGKISMKLCHLECERVLLHQCWMSIREFQISRKMLGWKAIFKSHNESTQHRSLVGNPQVLGSQGSARWWNSLKSCSGPGSSAAATAFCARRDAPATWANSLLPPTKYFLCWRI